MGDLMHRPLLLIGGVLNAVLTLFHIWLARQIHLMSGLAPGHRVLMEMLNAGGTLMLLFFAVGSLAFASDVLTTKLGKLFQSVVFLLYFSRAVEEIVIPPRFSAVIFIVCLLIASLYLTLLLRPLASRQLNTHSPRETRA